MRKVSRVLEKASDMIFTQYYWVTVGLLIGAIIAVNGMTVWTYFQ